MIERHDEAHVAVLRMNRPKRRNALSNALIEALLSALAEVDADAEVRAVVLTGAGKAFCAGGDLADGLSGGGGFVESHRGRGRFAELMAAIPRMATPVIAAVNGVAMGGGCGLVSACDLAVAAEDAKLGTPEIKLGLFPWIILAALQRDIGRKKLLELVLTGKSLSAVEAREMGLVNQVCRPGEAVQAAVALAGVIASRSPAVVGLGKQAFHQIADLDYEQALAYMHGQLSLNLLTEDAMEGVGAFLQKRPPQWKGR